MMNIERRISNRCHSTFDILRFIIRYLKKAGLGQGAGFRAHGAGDTKTCQHSRCLSGLLTASGLRFGTEYQVLGIEYQL